VTVITFKSLRSGDTLLTFGDGKAAFRLANVRLLW
jgi:hypothetical protein